MELVLESVTKKYQGRNGQVRGVEDVTMTVKDGEFIGLCGPSGSGKSTLFHMIAGILTPDAGSIKMNGKDIAQLLPEQRAQYRNQEIGYMMQGYQMLNHLSIYENLCLPSLFSRKREKDLEQKVQQSLNEVGMLEWLNEYPGQLSGGEYNRIQIARALMNEPKLILADEPTAGLDEKNATTIVELLQKIVRKGTAVILSTHQEQYLNDTKYTYRL